MECTSVYSTNYNAVDNQNNVQHDSNDRQSYMMSVESANFSGYDASVNSNYNSSVKSYHNNHDDGGDLRR